MKISISIFFLLFSLSLYAQRTSWQDAYNNPYYRNPVKVDKLFFNKHTSLANSTSDTASAYLYNFQDSVLYLYWHGVNYKMAGGGTNTVSIDESNLVHITGDESISGYKEFNTTISARAGINVLSNVYLQDNLGNYKVQMYDGGGTGGVFKVRRGNDSIFTQYPNSSSYQFPGGYQLALQSNPLTGVRVQRYADNNGTFAMRVNNRAANNAGNIDINPILDSLKNTISPGSSIDESTLVHLAGDETVTGQKTFANDVLINPSTNIFLKTTNAVDETTGLSFSLNNLPSLNYGGVGLSLFNSEFKIGNYGNAAVNTTTIYGGTETFGLENGHYTTSLPTGAGYTLTDVNGDGLLTMQPVSIAVPTLQQVHDAENTITDDNGNSIALNASKTSFTGLDDIGQTARVQVTPTGVSSSNIDFGVVARMSYKGFELPQYTTSNRDDLANNFSLPLGNLIYNTDTQMVEYWDGTQWKAVGGSSSGITDLNVGDLSPLFTSLVTSVDSVLNVSYALSTAPAHRFFGNNTGSTAAPSYSQITTADVSGLAAVATTGDYNSLINKPATGITSETDPTVASYIKTITTTNISQWNTAYGWGNHATAGYLTSVPAQSFASLTGKPTTLAGYGITDAETSVHAATTYQPAGSYELLSNKSTSTALGTSNTLYPTQNAVKVYADTKLNNNHPVSTGNTPSIFNATATGKLTGIAIGGTDAALTFFVTVAAGQSVSGNLCSITYSSAWAGIPKVAIGCNAYPGISTDMIKVSAQAIDNSTIDITANLPSPGTYQFTILSMQ